MSITVEEYSDLIAKLSGGKASGAYEILQIFVKNNLYKYFLSQTLSFIFNKLQVDGVLPRKLKPTRVFPILKKGPLNSIQNYRPISLNLL